MRSRILCAAAVTIDSRLDHVAGLRHADPIFQGLAISMVFGLLSSTLLTLLVIPAVYVWPHDDRIAL